MGQGRERLGRHDPRKLIAWKCASVQTAGAALGWASFSYLNFSEGRGRIASVVVGIVGGVLGGKMIAPMLTKPAAVPADFSMSALMFALLFASAVLLAANFVYKRWDL